VHRGRENELERGEGPPPDQHEREGTRQSDLYSLRKDLLRPGAGSRGILSAGDGGHDARSEP
jgi:hypothetical protein